MLSRNRWYHLLAILLVAIITIACDQAEPPPPPPPSTEIIPAKPVADFLLQKTAFSDLDGWLEDSLDGIDRAMAASCRYFKAKGGEATLTGKQIKVPVHTALPICDALDKIISKETPNSETLRRWVEQNFTPYRVWRPDQAQNYTAKGLFTGYYEAELAVAKIADESYRYPIWGVPKDRIELDLGLFDTDLMQKKIIGRVAENQFLPYFTRGELGAQTKMRVDRGEQPILWAKDMLDLFILHVQGSGIGKLPDGSTVNIGYAAHNGHGYRSIARYLIDQGALNRHQAGWQHIRNWMAQNPDQVRTLLYQNPRYIFFKLLPKDRGAVGSINQPLTAQRSLAIDPSHMPLGLPIWLDTPAPLDQHKPLRRLMVAQDTGAAIKGVIRGDFFWGRGKSAERNAGTMKSRGGYFLLLPKTVFVPDALRFETVMKEQID